MRTAVGAAALGLTLLAAAALAACSPPEPVAPPTPGPSGTPVFASDEEALAAAEEVYGAYQAAVDDLGEMGWADPTVLETVARGDLLRDERSSAHALREKGWRQVGRTTFDSITLQQIQDHGPGTVVVSAYLCIDVTAVDVVDAMGQSVVSEDRPDRQAVEIEIDDVDGSLKVNRSEPWTRQDFC